MKTFFIFDVESVGLHGEAFAVAGGVYRNGETLSEFFFACSPEDALGEESDRAWVRENIPPLFQNRSCPASVRDSFWREWEAAKTVYPGILMAGECVWPVETNFLSACAAVAGCKWGGPYPLHEIASVLLAAGMDPLKTYERLPDELPRHHPLADARLSARLLFSALHGLET